MAAARCFLSMAMAMLFSAAATAAAPPSPTIALPGCNATCGDVSVPYPFGFGPSRCYWPGLNLTCDTSSSHDPPRLLLGDGTFRVTNIFVGNSTLRVVPSTGAVINSAGDFTTKRWDVPFGRGFTEHGYMLSSTNELIVYGCNVLVKVLGDVLGEANRSVGGCASICTKMKSAPDGGGGILVGGGHETGRSKFCIDRRGCCRAPVTTYSADRVHAMWVDGGDNHTVEQKDEPLSVFVAERGWVDENGDIDGPGPYEAPIVLDWRITKGLPERSKDILNKSEHSRCTEYDQRYLCVCNHGYDGNPYLTSGCQDIDECKLPNEEIRCFGECINIIGSMECWCPHGTFGNPSVKGGCVKIHSTTAGGLLPTVDRARVGLPECKTTCGDVSVPYPFGISPRCSMPGFTLICNTTFNPPRLFIDSNSTLEVVNIFLNNSTVNVIQHINNLMHYRWESETNIHYVASFDLPDIAEPYMLLSTRHEFILSGCAMHATLYGKYRNDSSSSNMTIISGCNSTACSSDLIPTHTHNGYCNAPILAGSTPRKVEVRNLILPFRPLALISEERLSHQWHMISNITNLWMASQYQEYFGYGLTNNFKSGFYVQYWASPIVLGWAVKQGFSAPTSNSGQCPLDVASSLCKSKGTSGCRKENGGFTCHCNTGYEGNAYIDGGCKVIDHCNITASLGKPCLGECINSPNGYKCRCPRGTHGDPFKIGGCSPAGLIIGVSVASGAALLPMVLGIIFVRRKIIQHKVKALKLKYFKQNRGQLLQQLVSQKADIAERMIIPVGELEKATNNFDKARELGGGGHGTVYKGILSDLHVVAIKKSKITVQKEIDEFINEVAILSQINHRNVVKLFGCCLETEVPLLVYEFISNGTLYHHLHVQGPKSLSWGNRLRIATEIATSLAYLHSAVSIPIIHRDIKSSNILLDDTLTAKVSDFGASRYIPIEKTGLTTRVQGTIGYLDPMYFYTGRLTEKSDVYSFGVILVELLTRKKPFSYLSAEGESLVAHFVSLFTEGNLVQIMDPQVIDEGGEEVQEVAALAVSCINLRGEERPTMRQAEHTLEGSRSSKMYKNGDMVAAELENDSIVLNCQSSTIECQRFEESSRRYSLEQDMMMSARYPRSHCMH